MEKCSVVVYRELSRDMLPTDNMLVINKVPKHPWKSWNFFL